MHEYHNQRLLGETLITFNCQLFEHWCFDFHCSSIGLKFVTYLWV
jgi:hypothetical protein